MKLAINGGQPTRTKPFPIWPYFDDGEKQALIRSLEFGQWWRMSGREVNAFEDEFAQFHNAKSALAVTNGSHALEVALLALGVGPGDEVIVPAFTFIATSMSVQRVGAVAIPADIDLDNYCISLNSVRKLITEKTKAIIPVHMAGHGADMIGLEKIAAEFGISIIQDACHAHGAVFQNKKIGEWNNMACFSFQNFKLMTAGEGGIITFPSDELKEKAFLCHNCGRPANDKQYLHMVLGSNYRMSEFTAAVLREQLKRLPQQNSLREKNAKYLLGQLSKINGIIPQTIANYTQLNPYYMAMFCIDKTILPKIDRDAMVAALVAEGIPAFRNYKAIYKTESFWKEPAPTGNQELWIKNCPNTETVSEDGIWIHHRVLLGNHDDIDDIIKAIEKVINLL